MKRQNLWCCQAGRRRGHQSAGVPEHATFSLVVAWIALIYWNQSQRVLECSRHRRVVIVVVAVIEGKIAE